MGLRYSQESLKQVLEKSQTYSKLWTLNTKVFCIFLIEFMISED